MSGDLKTRLLEFLAEQAPFGALPIPRDVDTAVLRDAERMSLALGRRTERALLPTTDSLAETMIGLRASSPVRKPAEIPEQKRRMDLRWSSLAEIQAAAAACQACGIAGQRTNSVFGVGAVDADLVIVGEAPGEQEDLSGEPFVGPAGKLLDEMLSAIGFARADLYICNTLKCRPTVNRDPKPEELANCRPFLDHQLHFLKPKIILALGRVAGRALLGCDATLSSMRGKEFLYQGLPLRVTYHPAALLRNSHWKRPAWEDLQALRIRYDEVGGRDGSLPIFQSRAQEK